MILTGGILRITEGTAVEDAVAEYRKKNYKTDFEIWNKNFKLQSEFKNTETSQASLDSVLVGVKKSGAKTPATDSSACKEK